MTSIKPMVLLFVMVSAVACSNAPDDVSEVADAEASKIRSETLADSSSDRLPPRQESTALSGAEVLGAEHQSLIALSPEEAAWLDRHGYPTNEELEALLSYDPAKLEDAMRNRRDKKAAALLGHRRLLEGDVDGAMYAFAAGSRLGSIYARQQLALTTTQRVTGLPRESLPEADQGNLQVMVAQLEVAKLLGDHRAQEYIDRYAHTLDWEHYGKHVLTQAVEFMRQYGEDARARGVRPMGPDPRPNAEAWGRLSADPNAVVNVYERDGNAP